MSVLPFLLIASLIFGLLFLCAFIWAVKTGQFDDTATPGMRIFFEDTESPRNPREKEEET